MAGASSIKMMITNLTEKAIISPDLSRSRGRVIKLYRDTLRHIPWIKQTYQASGAQQQPEPQQDEDCQCRRL